MVPKFPALILLLTFAGMATPLVAQAPDPVQMLRWVEKSNPVEDAKKAISTGDFRLLLVHGSRSWLPGVPPGKEDFFRSKFSTKVIEGTSDVVKNDEHFKLIDRAVAYAKAYNRYVTKHIRVEQLPKKP